MCETGANQRAAYEHGGISAAFSNQEKLPPGTTPGKCERQAGKYHPAEIPQLIGMRDGLVGKTGMKLSQNQISYESRPNQGGNPPEKPEITGQYNVAYCPDSTEAASLCDKTDYKGNRQGNKQRSVLAARPGGG